MRCPKCGYISFDHLEECLKCKKNIKEATANLQGSVYKVPAPSFLKIEDEDYQESDEPVDLFGEDLAADEDEYIDEDIEILVQPPDEELADDEFELNLGDDDEVEIELSDDEEFGLESEEDELDEDGIEIDLGQFEDTLDSELAFDDDESSDDSDLALELDVPDELTDISDLAPPDEEPEIEADQEEPELNLDDLDFDLGMEGLEESGGSGLDNEKMLSLDEIDFTDTLSDSKAAGPGKEGMVSMDEDLDFELDLGGLSIHKEE